MQMGKINVFIWTVFMVGIIDTYTQISFLFYLKIMEGKGEYVIVFGRGKPLTWVNLAN